MPFSAAILAAEGAGGIVVWLAGGTMDGVGAAAGDAAPGEPLAAIWPSTAPGCTVAPVSTSMADNTPAAGALTSRVTLSVSSSTRGSSALTVSPAFLNHLATVASLTDSPSVGTMMAVPPAPDDAAVSGTDSAAAACGAAWLP